MYCMSQNNKNCGQFKRRLIALSLLLCFAIVSLSATIFIVIQAYHDCYDCSEKRCSVCVQIHKAQKLLERLGRSAGIISIAAVSLSAAIITWAKLDPFRVNSSTLVSVKVRLNN